MKVLCIIIILAFTGIFANQTTHAAEGDPAVITVGQITAQPGQQGTLQIRLNENPGLQVIRLIVEFDTERLQIDNIRRGVGLHRLDFFDPLPHQIEAGEFALIWLGASISMQTGVLVHIDFTILCDSPLGQTDITVSLLTEADALRDIDVPVPVNITNGGIYIAAPDGDPAVITVGQTTAQQGGQGTLQMHLDENPGIITLRLFLEYDDTRLQIDNIRRGAGLFDLDFDYSRPYWADSGEFVTLWLGTYNDSSTGMLINIDFTILCDAPLGQTDIIVSTRDESDAFAIDDLARFVPVPVNITNGGIYIIEPDGVDISAPAFAQQGDEIDIEIDIHLASSLANTAFTLTHSPYLILAGHSLYPADLCDGFIQHISDYSAIFGWGDDAAGISRAGIILHFVVYENAPLAGWASTLPIILHTEAMGDFRTHIRAVENREFSGILGDVNSSGHVSSMDAHVLAQYLVGYNVIIEPRAANLTYVGGDEITLTDFIALVNWLMGRNTPERMPDGTFPGEITPKYDAAAISVGNIPGQIGGRVRLPIYLDINPGISAMRFFIEYNPDYLQFAALCQMGAAAPFGSRTPIYSANSGSIGAILHAMIYTTNTGGLFYLEFYILDAAPEHMPVSITFLRDDDVQNNGNPVPIEITNGGIFIPRDYLYISAPIFAQRGDLVEFDIFISSADSLANSHILVEFSTYLTFASLEPSPEVLAAGFSDDWGWWIGPSPPPPPPPNPPNRIFLWSSLSDNPHYARLTLRFTVNENAPLGGWDAALPITLSTPFGNIETHVRVVENREFTGMLGDINNDGQINTADRNLLARYLIGENVIIDPRAANLTYVGGDEITLTDFVALANWVQIRLGIPLRIPERLPNGNFPGETTPKYDTAAISVGNIPGQIGERVLLPIRLTESPGISAMRFFVEYNADYLDFVGVSTRSTPPPPGTIIMPTHDVFHYAKDGGIGVIALAHHIHINSFPVPSPNPITYTTIPTGTVFYLEFYILDGASDNMPVSITFLRDDDAQYNGQPVPIETTNGGVFIPRDYFYISAPVFAQRGDLVEFDIYITSTESLAGSQFLLAISSYLTIAEPIQPAGVLVDSVMAEDSIVVPDLPRPPRPPIIIVLPPGLPIVPDLPPGPPITMSYHLFSWATISDNTYYARTTLRFNVSENAPLAGQGATLPIELRGIGGGLNTHVRVVENREFIHQIGDANGDGTISSADASHLARYLAGHNVILDPRAVNLTYHQGNATTTNDLMALVNWLVGRGTPERLR